MNRSHALSASACAVLLAGLWTPLAAHAEDAAGTIAPEVPASETTAPVAELAPTAPPPISEPTETLAAPAPEPELKTAEDPPQISDNDSIAQARREHLRVYEWTRPNWAVQVAASFRALGGENLSPEQDGRPMRGLSVNFEWQPEWIQAIGVLGIGPNINLYPVAGSNGVYPDPEMGIRVGSNWSAGAQARYQLRLFHEQPVVPVAGYQFEYLIYDIPAGGPGGRLPVMGPFFGAMLFLNFLEPSVASEGYVTNGIARSYLVAELRMLSGADENVTVGGKSYFFGLRIEF